MIPVLGGFGLRLNLSTPLIRHPSLEVAQALRSNPCFFSQLGMVGLDIHQCEIAARLYFEMLKSSLGQRHDARQPRSPWATLVTLTFLVSILSKAVSADKSTVLNVQARTQIANGVELQVLPIGEYVFDMEFEMSCVVVCGSPSMCSRLSPLSQSTHVIMLMCHTQLDHLWCPKHTRNWLPWRAP